MARFLKKSLFTYIREHSPKGYDWFGFEQTSKSVAYSTCAKQLNPNKINRRRRVQ